MTSRPEPGFYLSFFLFTTDPRPGDPAARELLLGQVRELVAMGYGGFELPIPPSCMADPEAEVQAYRQLRQALDAEGFESVALTTNVAATPDFDPTSADPAVRERALAYLRSRVEITAALRGTVMMGPIIYPYALRPRGSDGAELWSDALQEALPAGYARAATVLAELADHAAGLGVRMQNHCNRCTWARWRRKAGFEAAFGTGNSNSRHIIVRFLDGCRALPDGSGFAGFRRAI